MTTEPSGHGTDGLRDRDLLALVRGAGDIATGVALRLHRSGFAVVMTELAQPTVERRAVAFAEAVYDGHTVVEGVTAVLAQPTDDLRPMLATGTIPVVVDPQASIREVLKPDLLVDAVLAKRNTGTTILDAPAVVALGPGFVAGRDAHAVVETLRGHTLGRVITEGTALPNTGVPEELLGLTEERVVRAPADGRFRAERAIGDLVRRGDTLGHVNAAVVSAPIDGALRGLVRSGLDVSRGYKLGDVDPRGEREYCFLASDRALAVAGGVLEAACALLGARRFFPGWEPNDLGDKGPVGHTVEGGLR